jgi:hypothetical protein
MDKFIEMNAIFRANVLKYMGDNGIAVGALLRSVRGHDYVTLYRLSAINWSGINFATSNDLTMGVEVLASTGGLGGGANRFADPDWISLQGRFSWTPSVFSGAPLRVVLNDVPPGWLDGTSGVEKLFRDKKGDYYSSRTAPDPTQVNLAWPRNNMPAVNVDWE